MIHLERPEPEQNGRTKKSSLVPIILISLLLCTGLAGFWLFLAPSSPLKQRANTQYQAEQVQKESAAPQSSLASKPKKAPASVLTQNASESAVTQGQITSAEQVPTGKTKPQGKDEQCRELARRLHGFFSLLDNEEYIRGFHLGAPAQQYFLELAKKLLSNPPVVSRETDDLYTMLKNMAHFFRVIGGRNITIIKTILDRERDTIEDVAADLFQWTTGEQCNDSEFSFHAPVDKLYEYAGFFLNSMGGRSYLFRRDSRSRLLVSYYAILLVNRANEEGINKYGIDLRPLIPMTISEIEGSNQLIYKEKYLDSLYGLLEKYPKKRKISHFRLPHKSKVKWKRAAIPVQKSVPQYQG